MISNLKRGYRVCERVHDLADAAIRDLHLLVHEVPQEPAETQGIAP